MSEKARRWTLYRVRQEIVAELASGHDLIDRLYVAHDRAEIERAILAATKEEKP